MLETDRREVRLHGDIENNTSARANHDRVSVAGVGQKCLREDKRSSDIDLRYLSNVQFPIPHADESCGDASDLPPNPSTSPTAPHPRPSLARTNGQHS